MLEVQGSMGTSDVKGRVDSGDICVMQLCMLCDWSPVLRESSSAAFRGNLVGC